MVTALTIDFIKKVALKKIILKISYHIGGKNIRKRACDG